MSRKALLLVLTLFLGLVPRLQAQNQVLLDSLKTLLDTASGESRVDLLNKIGFSFGNSAPQKTVDYAKQALEEAQQLGYQRGAARATFNIGAGYFYQGTYELGLRYYLEAIEAFSQINNAEGVAHAEVAIGLLYNRQRNYEKALTYLRKSLIHNRELDAKRGIGISLVNLGDTFLRLDMLDSALYYQEASRKVFEEIQDKRALAYSLILLGQTYEIRNEPEKALAYYNRNLEVCESIGDRYSYVGTLNNIGTFFYKEQQYGRSLETYRKAIHYAYEGKIRERLKDAYIGIARTFAAQNRFDSAYHYRDQAATLNDSLVSQRSVERIAELQTAYETDKKERENAALRAQAEVQRIESRRNQQIIFLVILGAISLAVFSVILFRSRQQERQTNELLKQKNQEVEAQAEDIQQKNKNITASIVYAKRIQTAILPLPDRLEKVFGKGNTFVFYRPRDIVSGDFYWIKEVGDKIVFSVADCTGHGVPGALMSMIGSTTLSKIVGEKNILAPHEILQTLHVNISESLKQIETQNRDGMDIAVCQYDKKTRILRYAGARSPLYYFQEGELHRLTPDRQSVGGLLGKHKPYSLQEIQLSEAPAWVYLASDGYQDQFGGAKGRKFLTSRFRKLLASLPPRPMPEQFRILSEQFDDWQGAGNEYQTDDVTLMGVRL